LLCKTIDLEDNVWVFGYNNYGQLGLGDSAGEDDDTQERHVPVQIPNIKAKKVIAGDNHSAIIDWSVKTDREEFHSSDDDVWMTMCTWSFGEKYIWTIRNRYCRNECIKANENRKF